ncbi:MAG: VWA domain-containing protein [Acidobacteria bacterium]|nr:VWA domain-containing protein [Acidobacteriota bacterium]
MFERRSLIKLSFGLFISVIFAGNILSLAQEKGPIRTVTITVVAERENATIPNLTKDDFSVRVGGERQKILSVKSLKDNVPLYLALLIQDDVTGNVGNDLDQLREFIKDLPSGTHVLVAYARSGSNEIRQGFTADLAAAAKSLRIPSSSEATAPGSPYQAMIDVLKEFPNRSDVREVLIFISDGLDLYYGLRDSAPTLNLNLQRAINAAQGKNVVVYSIYAPTVGPAAQTSLGVSNGQSSLTRLSMETGGEAFFTGRDFISAAPHLKRIDRRLDQQYLITFRLTKPRPGFNRIKVTTEYPDLRIYVREGER